jgi:hypothetical protein
MTLTATPPEFIRESVASLDTASRVDQTSGVIRGVKIIGFDSQNGRSYTRQALSEACHLYEGVRVFADHDRTGSERKMKDFCGVLKNVKLKAGGLFADLHLVRSHPLSAAIFERAERMPESFGLSHFAEGEARQEGGRSVVRRIISIRSVDLVTEPATTNGLFESTAEDFKRKNANTSPALDAISRALIEVRIRAVEYVRDDAATTGAETDKREEAVTKAFENAIRNILAAMRAKGSRAKAVAIEKNPPATHTTYESVGPETDIPFWAKYGLPRPKSETASNLGREFARKYR